MAFAAFAWLARPLNLLSLGADSAEIARARRRAGAAAAFFSASLATGAAVSVGGPIGFVGIIMPHLVRLLVGSGSSPRAAGVGALRRRVPRRLRRLSRARILAPVELPVGIITALIGGPFFLWLLLRRPDSDVHRH